MTPILEYLKNKAIEHLCEQVIDGYLISTLDPEAINKVLSKQQAAVGIDLISTVCEMASQARERSHGGAPLSVVYVTEQLYNDLLVSTGVQDAKKCTIARVEIVLSNEITSKYPIVGICKPKFDVISPNLLVIRGEIHD